MVKEELVAILDSLKVLFDEKDVDPELLYSWFRMKNYLTNNEVYLIKNAGIPTMQINAFFTILKSKSDAIFLDEFHSIAVVHDWDFVFQVIEERLKELNFDSVITDKRSRNINMIAVNLKAFFKNDVEIIFRFWDKLGVNVVNQWKTFYNSNLVFTDETGTQLSLNSFNDLLVDGTFRRTVVSAPAGYGKSTFVHEVVRQWVCSAEWTNRFLLVFLFRLGDIHLGTMCNKQNRLSLKRLLQKCLSEKNVQLFESYFEEENLQSKMLFIFDGFDELGKDLINQDLNDLITGNSKYQPYVIVTCRPGNSFEMLKGFYNMYVELQGFNQSGVVKHLERFGVREDVIKVEFYDFLKVPLYATLFGILYEKEYCMKNFCILIDKTIKYLLRRHLNNDRTEYDRIEKKLFLVLGRVAEAQWYSNSLKPFFETYGEVMAIGMSFLYTLPLPTLPDDAKSLRLLALAKNASLILPSSTKDAIYFPHNCFAEYFRAYSMTNQSTVSKYFLGRLFTKPDFTCSLPLVETFSCFFSQQYKNSVWKNFERATRSIILPYFDEYESLPCIQPRASEISFDSFSYRVAFAAIKKLKFKRSVKFSNLNIEEFSVGNILNVPELELFKCSLNVSVQNFFVAYNTESLQLTDCTVKYCQSANVDCGEIKNLKTLIIRQPNGAMCYFVNEILRSCKSLKLLVLEDITDIDWLKWIKDKNISEGKLEYGIPTTTIDVVDFDSAVEAIPVEKFKFSCIID